MRAVERRRRKGPVLGRDSWRSVVGVLESELSRRRPRLPPASMTAPDPPTAASEPEAAREIVEMDVKGVGVMLDGGVDFKGWVARVRKPVRLREWRSAMEKKMAEMGDE